MFLSISIPVYNAENYIERCVESIIEQTCKDFEIILVNDGSKDGSLEKCYGLERKHPDLIRVINKENSGSLLTRRRCIKESRGDYLYIMDADDYLNDINAIKIIKNVINEYNSDLVLFNATTKNKDFCYSYPFRDKEIFENNNLDKIYKCLVEGDELNSLWNKVFSRDLVDWQVSYEQFGFIKNGTDMFQVIPLIMNAKKVVYIDKALYFYRVDNNESIVHKFNPYVYDSLKANLARLYKEIKDHGKISPEIDELFSLRYMKIVSTAAFKVRMIRNNEHDGYKYLRNIGNDLTFREYYKKCNKKKLSLFRRVIVRALFNNRYMLLFKMIQVYGRVEMVMR